LELDFVQIGTILALGLVATMLLQLIFGQLTDQGHARWILILGFAGIVVADLILPISTVFIQVLVFYVLLRSAAAVYHPVSFSSIGRTYAERTAAFGYQGAIGDLGLTVGTLSTGILAQTWGWRLPFWFWGAVGAILFAYFCTSVFQHKVGFYSQPIQISGQMDDPGNSRSLKAAFVVLAAVSSITTTTFILFTGYMPLFQHHSRIQSRLQYSCRGGLDWNRGFRRLHDRKNRWKTRRRSQNPSSNVRNRGHPIPDCKCRGFLRRFSRFMADDWIRCARSNRNSGLHHFPSREWLARLENAAQEAGIDLRPQLELGPDDRFPSHVSYRLSSIVDKRGRYRSRPARCGNTGSGGLSTALSPTCFRVSRMATT